MSEVVFALVEMLNSVPNYIYGVLNHYYSMCTLIEQRKQESRCDDGLPCLLLGYMVCSP